MALNYLSVLGLNCLTFALYAAVQEVANQIESYYVYTDWKVIGTSAGRG